MSELTVSFLGLGPMGKPMALRLLRHLGRLIVWNRTRDKVESLVRQGAVGAATPAEAAQPLVFIMFPDLPQIAEVVYDENGLLEGWRSKRIRQPILVIHSTVSPNAVCDFADQMWRQYQVIVLDAPVSGGTIGAAEGTLSIMIGGDRTAANQVMPVLHCLGRTIRYFGPSGSGAMAKLCNQIAVAGYVTALSEAFLLARRNSLDLASLIDIFRGGLADSAVLRQKAQKWLTNDYREGGSSYNQLKDLRFALDAAESSRLVLPLTEVIAELFAAMVSHGDGGLDHTAVVREIERRSSSR
ncbi:MAG: NAD(P)-dependent oxidoreductase [Acidothermus cellulolyticus]|nr:NAD(P)-dependent oxidoreductase [Acidothermus cellulolyticus]